MTTTATLRELHRLHRHVQDLQDQLARGPKLLEAHQAKIAKQDERIKEAQDAIKKLKVSIHEKEVSLKTKHGQITKHERQLNESAGKKEYDALKSEIAAERSACAKLEEEILAAMEEVDVRTGKLPELEKEVQQAKKETAKVIDDIQSKRAGLTDMLAAAHKQLQEVEATLPEDVREPYHRQVNGRGGPDSLSAVQGRTCVACYTEITSQSQLDLIRGSFVLCKSCGRMLYLSDAE